MHVTFSSMRNEQHVGFSSLVETPPSFDPSTSSIFAISEVLKAKDRLKPTYTKLQYPLQRDLLKYQLPPLGETPTYIAETSPPYSHRIAIPLLQMLNVLVELGLADQSCANQLALKINSLKGQTHRQQIAALKPELAVLDSIFKITCLDSQQIESLHHPAFNFPDKDSEGDKLFNKCGYRMNLPWDLDCFNPKEPKLRISDFALASLLVHTGKANAELMAAYPDFMALSRELKHRSDASVEITAAEIKSDREAPRVRRQHPRAFRSSVQPYEAAQRRGQLPAGSRKPD